MILSYSPTPGIGTLQGINISHLGKRKIIFKMPFLGDMLVPWRVYWNPLKIGTCYFALKPKQCTSIREIPPNYQIFAFFDPPKMGNFMIPAETFRSFWMTYFSKAFGGQRKHDEKSPSMLPNGYQIQILCAKDMTHVDNQHFEPQSNGGGWVRWFSGCRFRVIFRFQLQIFWGCIIPPTTPAQS